MGTTYTYQRPPAPPTDRDVTPEELYFNQQWGRCELVDGKVILMSPAGHYHGEVGATLLILIGTYVRKKKLGKVYDGQTGFVYPNGKTVRAPDVMFLSKARIPRNLNRAGYLPVSPDFAIEVLSPEDSFAEVSAKAESYLAVGVKLVWVVLPDTQKVHVYRPGTSPEIFHADATLTGESVLPGFKLRISDVFEY